MKASRSERDQMRKAEEIRATLAQFSGTTVYHRYSALFPFMLLTDGTRYLAQNCKCYWLLDTIASMQYDARIYGNERLQEFQCWRLVVNRDRTAVLTCEWDSDQIVYRTELDYTDFPLQEVRIWVQPWYNPSEPSRKLLVAFLPSEY